jgi:hypothetical protein
VPGALRLAGGSERDRALRAYLAERLVRRPGTHTAPPTVLLLGPRGSGKTTLLGHLTHWAARAPVAHLDFAALGRIGAKPIDVLARLAFDLNEKKPDFPRLAFPTFGLLLIAVSTRVDLSSRERAVQQMKEALAAQAPRRDHGGSPQLQGVLEALAETAATALGAPNWAIAPALRLLPGWGEDWAGLRVRRRLARIRREGGSRPVDGFVVTLNRLYHESERTERHEAEEVLFDAFLADLERSYHSRRGDHDRTSNCLLLLDNAETTLGDDFLDLLLRAREKAGFTDPLLTLATAAARPEALARREPGGIPRPGAYLCCWEQPRSFTPVPVDDTLAVGQLRDLDVREVSRIAETVLRTGPSDGALPDTDDGVRWLGWLVHQLTHGQPAATAAVFEALRDADRTVPWDERLRDLFDPALVTRLLDRLLPADTGDQLRTMLARSAAAVNLGQAGAATELWREAGDAVGGHFARFSGDPLRTMHLSTGDPLTDGSDETLHPLLRFLLLRELTAQDGTSDAWDAAHTAMSLRAAVRVDNGHPEEEWLVAYHELASGHLEAAVGYLDARFDRLPAEKWCTELCRLRRAPVRTPGGALPDSPRRHFDGLVGFLSTSGRPFSRRTKAVTRLLAACWISPEPRDDPDTDRIGDPYRNPLGDPYAELYDEISEEFLVLRGLVDDGADRHVLLQKSEQYRRRPWW